MKPKTGNKPGFLSAAGMLEKLIYSIVFSAILIWLLYIVHLLFRSNWHRIWIFFALPGEWNSLLRQPWSLFTYAWIHLNLFGFFFNLILLWFTGKLFLTYENEKKLFRVFMVGILSGAAGFLISYHLLPYFFHDEPNAYLTGISSGFLAWMGYLAYKYKDVRVYIRLIGYIKIRWIFYFFLLWDLIQFPVYNSGGHMAHIFGLFSGMIYALAENTRKKESPFKVYDNYKTGREKKLDIILDKINRRGIQSLTDEEKAFLEKESKR